MLRSAQILESASRDLPMEPAKNAGREGARGSPRMPAVGSPALVPSSVGFCSFQKKSLAVHSYATPLEPGRGTQKDSRLVSSSPVGAS